MNTETGQIYREPTPEQMANPKVVPITEEEAKLLDRVPEDKRAETLRVLRSITGYKPAENEANVMEALKAERVRQDKLLGLSEDDPEELKVAVRNMGPLTRKRFFKKLNNHLKLRNGHHRKEMSQEKLQEYISHFTANKETT